MHSACCSFFTDCAALCQGTIICQMLQNGCELVHWVCCCFITQCNFNRWSVYFYLNFKYCKTHHVFACLCGMALSLVPRCIDIHLLPLQPWNTIPDGICLKWKHNGLFWGVYWIFMSNNTHVSSTLYQLSIQSPPPPPVRCHQRFDWTECGWAS